MHKTQIGTRITYPDEAGLYDVDLLQISIYYGMNDNLQRVKQCTEACRAKGIRYVIHPVMYSLLDEEMFQEVKEMAGWSDLGIILHDEKAADWQRPTGQQEALLKTSINELRDITPVSFENATDTKDVIWFWDQYADSITLDIGHVELAGFDSVEFIKSLDTGIIKKIHYVHMHRNNGWRNGLSDHWYLTPDCREVRALRELLRKKSDVSVLLEINETEMIGDSLAILRSLRDEISG